MSDESNTLSNQTAFSVRKQVAKKAVQASLENISNIQLSEDESDDEKEEEDPTPASMPEREVQMSTTSKPVGKKLSTWTPKKPRRVPLISTKRTSPLKNDSTWFESQHDANNLDKNRSNNASMVLDQTLGEEASIDLGLERSVNEVENGLENLRKSPRKHKRKASISPDSPRAKKAKKPEKAEFTDKKELSLFFSPEKRTPSEELSRDEAREEERPKTPTICKALGLQRNESFKEEGEIGDDDKETTASRSQEREVSSTDSQTKSKSHHRSATDGKERKERNKKSDSRKGKDPERKASKSLKSSKSSKTSRESRKEKSSKQESSSKSSRSRSKSKSEKPKTDEKRRTDSKSQQIPVSSPRKSERKVPNILRRSPSKVVKVDKIKPPAKEDESKGKKSSGKEIEKKIENLPAKTHESKVKKSSEKEKGVKVSQKSSKESDLLKVQDTSEGLVEDGKKELKKKKPVPTFEQLVADSEKILATLRMTQATTASDSSKEKSDSRGNSSKNLKEPTNTSKFGLNRSSFFVFDNKLPFGCFEEDI